MCPAGYCAFGGGPGGARGRGAQGREIVLPGLRGPGFAPQVIAPSAGGPAERAGVAPKDELLAIGGRPTEGMSLYEAGELLQGPQGSQARPKTLTLKP